MGLRHDNITCIVWIPWNPSEDITFSQLNHPPDDHGQERKIYGATLNLKLRLFWLDETIPKASSCHLPSLLAFWMIHVGPWDRQRRANRDGKTFVYAIMGMPSHMNTHESWEWLCFGCAGRWCLFFKDPGSSTLLVIAVSCFFSLYFLPKKVVSSLGKSSLLQ